ncbi:hypothetical protein V8G54_037792 [Vigna mungo]|uniref:Uncharacterized protein n=1 Tax=Vigna mungo TaxID=3915 RepID=A0AAQ3RGU3_VIGMU
MTRYLSEERKGSSPDPPQSPSSSVSDLVVAPLSLATLLISATFRCCGHSSTVKMTCDPGLPLFNPDHHGSDWVSRIATVTLGLGFCSGFDLGVEDKDARKEMTEKKTLAQRSDIGCEEDDLVVVDGAMTWFSWCGLMRVARGEALCVNGAGGSLRTGGFGGVNGAFKVMVEDDGELRLAARLMVVEIGFGGGKVGDSGGKGFCVEEEADVAGEGVFWGGGGNNPLSEPGWLAG